MTRKSKALVNNKIIINNIISNPYKQRRRRRRRKGIVKTKRKEDQVRGPAELMFNRMRPFEKKKIELKLSIPQLPQLTNQTYPLLEYGRQEDTRTIPLIEGENYQIEDRRRDLLTYNPPPPESALQIDSDSDEDVNESDLSKAYQIQKYNPQTGAEHLLDLHKRGEMNRTIMRESLNRKPLTDATYQLFVNYGFIIPEDEERELSQQRKKSILSGLYDSRRGRRKKRR